MEIKEFKFRNIGTYEVIIQGFLKGADLAMTRAVRPREELTFFFEQKENSPMYRYSISMFTEGDEIQGTYLTSLKRRSGIYLHVYYKKEKLKDA